MISVIVPTYNYGRFLGQALESVRLQSFRDWECLIVDDGSLDDTREVADGFVRADPRFRYLHQSNQGLASARNIGLRQTRGEYVQFLDADDIIESEKLEKQAAYLDQHPEVDVVYGKARRFVTEDMLTGPCNVWGEEIGWTPRLAGSGRETLVSLLRSCLVPHSVLMRRSVSTRIGWFDPRLRASHDWHYWIRCAAQGVNFQLLEVPGTVAFYRRHPASMVANSGMMLLEGRKLRRCVAPLLKDSELRLLNRRLNMEHEGHYGLAAMKYGEVVLGVCQLLRAAASSRGAREKLKWLYCAALGPVVPEAYVEGLAFASVCDTLRRLSYSLLNFGQEVVRTHA